MFAFCSFTILLIFIHISSYFFMLADCLFRPAQIQNCIVLTLFTPVFAECCTQCNINCYVAHWTGRSMEFSIIKIFLCIWWNFPLNGGNSAKPDLNIWLILSYIPVINATQVWLTINPNLFTQNIVLFCHGMSMSIVRLTLFLGLQL